MNRLHIQSKTALDTKLLATTLAQHLSPPTIISLEGELGVGKTTFCSSFINACSKDFIYVQSPTYAISHTYNTKPPITHIDLYRFSDSEHDLVHLEDLGILDAIHDPHSFKLIEWPLKEIQNIAQQHIKISFSYTLTDSRDIEIIFSNDYSIEFITLLRHIFLSAQLQ